MYWRASHAVLIGLLLGSLPPSAAVAANATPAEGAAPTKPGAAVVPSGSTNFTATYSELERNHLKAEGVEIVDTSHGSIRVTADHLEANGPDFADSLWILTGHVQAHSPDGLLQADHATVQLANNHITVMTANGAPAQFQRAIGGTETPAHGHAQTIIYDLEHGQLQLQGDGWLTDGCNEVESQHIQYDIAAGRVQALSGDGARVRGLIRTPGSAQCATATPAAVGKP